MFDIKELKKLGIIQYQNPILNQSSFDVTDFGEDTSNLIERMFDVTYKAPGAGLSAIQLGVRKKIFVMDLGYRYNTKEPRVFVNPKIIERSKDLISIEEGCLSFANVWVPVKRNNKILVEYQDAYGKSHQEEFVDYESIVVQHEYDHLEGLTFLDRISRLRKSLALKKIKKEMTKARS